MTIKLIFRKHALQRMFQRTIAVTLGLPFIRTSVDHGTAFDLAGKGIANPLSMTEAIRLAAVYAPLYRRRRAA